jgi:seryl-tRNA(Sec) selenium transferase
MKNGVVMHAGDQRYKCDVAVRCAGASIVHIGDRHGAAESQLREVLGDNIAAIVIVHQGHCGQIPLNQVVSIAKEQRIPVLVDAAGSVPPKENLWRLTRDLGVDAIVVSGGKGLRGPQSTGLILGTSAIIEGCRYHGVPNTRVGRGMKVGKEELAGIYAAVRHFMTEDHSESRLARVRQIEHIMNCLSGLPQISVRRRGSDSVEIIFDSEFYAMDHPTAAGRLLSGNPGIYVGHSITGLIVSSACLCDGEENIVADQMRRLFAS